MTSGETSLIDLGPSLSLEGRVHIYPSNPLHDLSSAGGVAYAARLRGDASQELVAFVCKNGFYPRIEQLGSLKNVESSSMIRLRDSGLVHWPADNMTYYAIVYEKPLAERYWKSLNEKHPLMSEDGANQSFVFPLIRTLAEFQRTGLVHGGIRVTNIFWREGSTTAPQIGEALSAPCGVGQPVEFETVERGMCPPTARGYGRHADDCYAFGVSLAMVILGYNPFAGMDDASIIQAKISKGTFGAMIGQNRLSPGHIELLRGLLADDARQRWEAADLEQWMTGRRLTPKNSDMGRRASRHFDVAGKEYWQVRPLAMALSDNVDTAVKLIENGSLEKWLIRSLGDEERSKNVAEAINQSRESNKSSHYADGLVTRVCIALDPSAPIKYRGLSVMPSGIGTALADAVLTGDNLQVLSEIISGQFMTTWVNMQKDAKADLVPIAQQLERMKALLEKTSFGSGVERVLYELNPKLPCLSPLVRSSFVLAPRFILPALEQTASRGMTGSDPMDRHIAAFLITRDRKGESLFVAMGPNEPTVRRGLALLSLFGDMQYRFGPDKLPKLCSWILPLVEPCLSRFFSKPFQDKVRRQAKEAVDQGSISLLLQRVDDPARVVGDEQDFLQARKMYRDVQREIAMLEVSLKDKGTLIRDIGKPVAASLASIIGIVLISLTLGRALIRSMFGG